MKKPALLLLLLALTTSAPAQIISWEHHRGMTIATEGSFQGVYLSYNPISFNLTQDKQKSTFGGQSVAVGYYLTQPVAHFNNTYIGLGCELQRLWYSHDNDAMTTTRAHFFDFDLPVELMKTFELSPFVLVAPSIGLNPSVYFAAREEVEHNNAHGLNIDHIDLFSPSQSDGNYHHFVMGYHIGCRLLFDQWYLGATYQRSLTGIYSNDGNTLKYNMFKIFAGVTF